MSNDIIIIYDDGSTQEMLDDFKRKRAERRAKRKAKLEAKQERMEAWGTKIADSLHHTTDKIRANNEYWYKRLGIKRKPKK